MTCAGPGFGTGRWGIDPYGGSTGSSVGGPLPVVSPFDVYCVGPCGPIAALLTHPEVTTVGDSTQFPIDGTTGDQELVSGGSNLASTAAIFVNKGVPENFTFEFTVTFGDLPPDFSDLPNCHAFFGAFSPSAGSAGLFFSRIGLAYVGAVHLNGLGDLILDTPVQDLANSQVLVSENESWTVRIASSFSTGTVYIYVTQTAQLGVTGHQLRYVLPVIPSASAAVVPPSETLISVRGTVTDPVTVSVDSLCLGTGLIIPGIPPKADAGADQAIRFCSVLRLDGSASYDPQGADLTYAWRLLDAPSGSQYGFEQVDGLTTPGTPATGFTDRLYSASLQTLDHLEPIVAGDVIVLAGEPYNIVNKGDDPFGFFVRVDGYFLPDNLSSNTSFKYIRQNGLNTRTSQKPTFYPDVAGIFKFDLIVSDGSLFSSPAVVIANAVESVVARGVVPDVSFIWNYLSDFWNLVEDTDRITTFWQGLAQVAAAELLSLWQVDYSKSLRDVQRTFQRRWLHYDLLVQENPALAELSMVRAIYGGLASVEIPLAGLTGVTGTRLDLQLSTFSFSTSISFAAPDPYTVDALQALIQATLAQVDTSIAVRVLPRRDGLVSRLRIDAPYPVTVLPTSTCPAFVQGAESGAPAGTAGVGVVTSSTYRVERSLQYLNIQLNDFLCVAGTAYRIARVVDDPSDPYPFQRLALLDPIEAPAGMAWSIAGTVVSPDLDFWNGLCEEGDIVTYEVLNTGTLSLTEATGVVLGSSSVLTGSLPVDASSVGAYLAQPATYSVFLKSVLRRRYLPLDPLIVDVPYLQENIVSVDDTQVLRRNVDFFLDTFRDQPCLRFITPVPTDAGGDDVWQGAAPPAQLWAEVSYLDNRPRIEGNFGIIADFTLDDLAQLPSNVDYLSAVQGLWYSYFNGPTVFNLRVGAQILLGLPFAEQAGTIVEIRDDFSTTTGRILVQDLADATLVRDYTFPASLKLEVNPATGTTYTVGDTVAQFAPLVAGVEVYDWVNNPTWFQGYLEQGAFFEVEKFHKFLVRVDSAAFNLAALTFVRSFVLRIKPTYTYPLFIVRADVSDGTEVEVTTLLAPHGTLHLYDGACFASLLGNAQMFDDPRAGGGGWRNSFDNGIDPTVVPTFPTPSYPIVWAYDQMYLCPEDAIVGTARVVFASPTLPSYDSIFAFDLPVSNAEAAQFAAGSLSFIAPTGGTQVGLPAYSAITGTMTVVEMDLEALNPGNPNTFHLIIEKNGAVVATVPFTLTVGDLHLAQAISVAVTPSDLLTCFIATTAAHTIPVEWSHVAVTLGSSVSWSYDTTLPAGTYYSYRSL